MNVKGYTHIAGNFCQFCHLVQLAKILFHDFCVNSYIEYYDDLYYIGENLFHQTFLQYKCTRACPAKFLCSDNFRLYSTIAR